MRDNVINIAYNEIGYKEKSKSANKDELYNKTAKAGSDNYTKYGLELYGFNPIVWCCCFVSWVANQCGIMGSLIPKSMSCTETMNWFKNKGQFKARGSYTPQKGDLIFYNWSGKSNPAEHIGIIKSVNGSTLEVIEGNINNAVGIRNISKTKSTIIGYGLPAYDNSSSNAMQSIKYVKGTDGHLSVRTGAGTSYTKVDRIAEGSQVTVYDISGSWARIGDNKWVSNNFLSDVKPNLGITKYVTGANGKLNIRSGAGTGYKIVGKLNNGDKVTVYDVSGSWARIGNGQWCSNNYLSETKKTTNKKIVYNCGRLRVRKGPGLTYKVVRYLNVGTEVKVLENKGSWARIGLNEWVGSKYLKNL